MANDSINHVITSPPYNMNLRIRYGKYCSRSIDTNEFSTKYEGFNDNLPVEEYYNFHDAVLCECLRVASGLVFYQIQIVTGSKRPWFKLIGDYHQELKDIIIWDKGHAQPSMAPAVLNKQSELILVFDKNNSISRQFPQANFDRGTLSDIWQINRQRSVNKKHRATTPEALIEKIILNFTNKHDIIYDPFMGTGTTAKVAIRNDRYYIGSEINEDYINS
jgi:site-specific DNA-methyltransferase (adenine-specific)/modification methylase